MHLASVSAFSASPVPEADVLVVSPASTFVWLVEPLEDVELAPFFVELFSPSVGFVVDDFFVEVFDLQPGRLELMTHGSSTMSGFPLVLSSVFLVVVVLLLLVLLPAELELVVVFFFVVVVVLVFFVALGFATQIFIVNVPRACCPLR